MATNKLLSGWDQCHELWTIADRQLVVQPLPTPNNPFQILISEWCHHQSNNSDGEEWPSSQPRSKHEAISWLQQKPSRPSHIAQHNPDLPPCWLVIAQQKTPPWAQPSRQLLHSLVVNHQPFGGLIQLYQQNARHQLVTPSELIEHQPLNGINGHDYQPVKYQPSKSCGYEWLIMVGNNGWQMDNDDKP